MSPKAPDGSSGRYQVTAKQVNEVISSEDLQSRVRYLFKKTLELDKRYEVIAYVVALMFLRNGEKEALDGYHVSEIRSESVRRWPEGFKSIASGSQFRVLLDEMVGLGVLRRAKANYSLRSPNVVTLLGTEQELLDELDKQREVEPEYEPATFRSPFGASTECDPSKRSPLTAQQEYDLQGRKSGVVLVAGSTAAGMGDLMNYLSYRFGGEFLITIERVLDINGFRTQMKSFLSKAKQGTNYLVVPETCPWTVEWVNEAITAVEKDRHKNSALRVVFLADPAAMWQLVMQVPDVSGLAFQGVKILSLEPWRDSTVYRWLSDCGLPADSSVREAIAQVSGNWPILLQEFYLRAQMNTIDWKQHLDGLDQSLQEPGFALNIARAMGIESGELRTLLHDLSVLGPISPQELASVEDGLSEEHAKRVVQWADLLCLARPTGSGVWETDPLVGRILRCVGG